MINKKRIKRFTISKKKKQKYIIEKNILENRIE